MTSKRPRIAICYPTDPAGFVPGGVDSFIRGILRWAPDDLDYTLIGATSDPVARPKGRPCDFELEGRRLQYLPIVNVDPRARRGLLPLTVRYVPALWRLARRGGLAEFQVLDFHRIEPVLLFDGRHPLLNLFLHNDMATLRNAQSDMLWRYLPGLYEKMEARLLRRVARVHSVRETAVARYRELYPADADKFRFIPTWVDTDRFHPLEGVQQAAAREELRRELRVSADAKLLLFVGRLDRQKNPLLLLESFAQAAAQRPELQLVIVGDGVLRPDVERWLQSNLAGNRVHLLGVQPGARIASLLRAVDVFVMSSAYEGMPIAVLEALASGVPVVSTDVGELRRVVSTGANGALAVEQSAPALAAALESTLAGLASQQGSPCIAAVQNFRPQVVLQTLYQMHREQCA